jgi:hypothetical protein
MRTAVDEPCLKRLAGCSPRPAYEEILRHPRLADARKVFLDRLLDLYDDNPFLVRLLMERGRLSVFLMTIVLEAAQDPRRRESWVTVGRLKREMASFGLGSARHVDGLIARLCEVGLVELRPVEDDRRVKLVHATEIAHANDRAWLAMQFAPLAVCFPQRDYGKVLRRDPQFHRHFRRTGAPLLRLGARLMRAAPDMNVFFVHAGGYMVLAALLQAAIVAGDRLAALPYARAGERFGISRTQVRRLLVLAEAAGLVRLRERGGHHVEILPRLWTSHDRAMACGMYLHDLVHAAASRPAGWHAAAPAVTPHVLRVVESPAIVPAMLAVQPGV